jgi:NADH-quinone oxidoreductase subunit J
VLRGQRLAGLIFGVGFAVLLVGLLGNGLTGTTSVGLSAGNAGSGGNVTGIGRLIFTQYLFAFELTSALLITAALGAMVLAYSQSRGNLSKIGQRATVEARLRGEHDRISPLPGPGVFATANSVATPALLPDGSIAPESLSELIESAPADEPPPPSVDAHALTGAPAPTDSDLTGETHR